MREVGGRGEAAFSLLLDRLPDAGRRETDAYRVYGWLPRDRHAIGKGGAVNRNEGLSAFQVAEQAEQAGEARKGKRKER